MITIYLGPNGYGKTRKLENEKKSLISSGVDEKDILFLESEILLMDEVKDTKDESKTMEFILQELLMNSSDYINAKMSFEKQIDIEILSHQSLMNDILNEILEINGNSISPDFNFIDKNNKISFKNLVKINTDELKKKTGSGQRMHLILNLIAKSNSKKYIFLDEPEKYSHPSLIHKTASLIRKLDFMGKNIYIATHSPKLISMIDVSFDNIFIINDSSHLAKPIDFDGAVKSLDFKNLASMGKKDRSFYDVTSLKKNIKDIYYKDFIECLFANKIYLCEGINDKFFILKALKNDNKFFDDYCIFQTFGKYSMPIFEKLFSSLGIKTEVIFDSDKKKDCSLNDEINIYLENLNHYEFIPSIEEEIGYSGEKYNSVSFLSFLDVFEFESGKYIK